MVALFPTLSGLHAASDDRPNILWIIVEDTPCHIGPYGETAIKTLKLDALEAQGVTCTAAYVTAPECLALITGVNQAANPKFAKIRERFKRYLPTKNTLPPQ